MIFFMESLAACLLFTLLVVPAVLKNPLGWISDYPPAIQARAKELGLVPGEQKAMPASVIVRKLIACLIFAVLLALLMTYVNGAETFLQGFLWSYALYAVVAWYDALVIDCLWFCHCKKIIIPGTEDLVKSYHDYWFHIKMSCVGMLLGLPVCLLAGLGVFLLA